MKNLYKVFEGKSPEEQFDKKIEKYRKKMEGKNIEYRRDLIQDLSDKEELKVALELSKYSMHDYFDMTLEIVKKMDNIDEAVEVVCSSYPSKEEFGVDPLNVIKTIEAPAWNFSSITGWSEKKKELQQKAKKIYACYIEDKERDFQEIKEEYSKKISQLEKELGE